MQWALCALGLVLGGYWVLHHARTWTLEARHQGRWAANAAAQLQTAAIAPPTPGSVIGRLEIPDAGVDAIILEGVSARELDRGIGHIPGTALPGARGNISLAAHRDTHFRGLRDVRVGQGIRVTTDAGYLDYRVTATSVVEPEDTHVLDASDRDELTLVTCYPFAFVGAAPQRFIVHAERLPADLPSPGATP